MKEKIKKVLDIILDFFMNCMGPLVSAFILLGLFNSVAVILGPIFLNVISEDSDLYTNFQFVGDCIAYFIPVILAYTSSKYFKTDTILSLILVTMLLYPNFIEAINNSYTIYGVAVPNISYASSIIPVIMIVAAQKYVEMLAKKIIPESLQMSLFPFFVVLIMLPLEFCLLGPAGSFVSNLLAKGVIGLYESAAIVETTVISAVQPYLCAFGLNRPIFFVSLDILLKNGVDYAYLPIAMGISNFTAMGISLGYAIKTKIKKEKQVGISAFVSAAIGGVSEPMLFGILLSHKKAVLPTLITGAVGGLLLGIFKLGYYNMGPSSAFGLISYISPDKTNLLYGIIISCICLVLSCVLMILLYVDEEDKK